MDRKAFKGEAILIQKITRTHSIKWYVVKNSKTSAIATPPAALGGVGSIVDHERQRLIYFMEKGIASYDFATKREKLLLSIDTNLFRVRAFWLDTEKDVLYFIRQKYSPAWKVLLANLKEQNATAMKVECSLMAYFFKSGVLRQIALFGETLAGGVADIRDDVFYARSKQKILILDINSGRILNELPEQNSVQICLAPDNKVLVWGMYSSVVYQLGPNGRKTISTFEGLFPSFSGNGLFHSFWKCSGEFYATDPRSKSSCVLKFKDLKNTAYQQHFHSAVWCPDNRHFALQLDLPCSDKGSCPALFLFDMKTKAVSFCSRNILDFNWLK